MYTARNACLIIPLLACLSAEASRPEGATLYDAMSNQDTLMRDVPINDRVRSLEELYLRFAHPSVLRMPCEISGTDGLAALYSATALMAHYNPNETWVERVSCIHAALESAGLATQRHHRQLHGLLIAARKFSEANLLQDRTGIEAEKLPTLRLSTTDGLKVIRLGPVGNLVDGALDRSTSSGTQVIAIVHPHCGPSRRALQAIVDSQEHAALRATMTLVVPREPVWPEKAMRKWNEMNPDLQMHAQSAGAEWEALETRETPVFHVLRGGTLVKTVTGWQGHGEELKSLMLELHPR